MTPYGPRTVQASPAWGCPHLGTLYGPEPVLSGPFKRPGAHPLDRAPDHARTPVPGSRSPGALLAQLSSTSYNKQYVKLAPVSSLIRAFRAGALALLQADLQMHVSSQPRRFFKVLENGSDRMTEPKGDSGSGPKEPPTPQVVRWSEQRDPGIWVISIPGGGAFCACLATVSSDGFVA